MSIDDLTKEFLEEHYCKKGKTYQAIADMVGCNKSTVIDRARKYGIASKTGRNRLEVLGKKFGLLKVLKEDKSDPKHLKYFCQCDCGGSTTTTASCLVRGQKGCWECRGKRIGQSRWQGYKDISLDFWSSARRSAERRDIEFSVTIEEGWQKFIEQNKKCALSGIDLKFKRNGRGSASLDRIDSSLSYTKENIQWLHKTVNKIKWDLKEEEFLYWCKTINENQNNSLTLDP